MTTFGNPCVDQSFYVSTGNTHFDTTNPTGNSGTLTQVCIYVASGGTTTGSAKVKVFRLVGSDYVFIGESGSQALGIGTNTFSGLNIPILVGDYIGLYETFQPSDTTGPAINNTVGSYKTKAGDITTTTPTSGWSSNTGTISILATYTITSSDIYVNSSTGSDSNTGDSCIAGHPVLTFQKAYDLLASGGTIHCCNDADFSSETVTLNKSFSIDRNGSAGSFYMPKAN